MMTIDLTDHARLLRRGIPDGAGILLLPELAEGGYSLLKRGGGTHRIGDGYFTALRALSAGRDTVLVPGSARVLNADGSFTNTVIAYQNGRAVHRYDKAHLFASTNEDRLFRPGRKPRTFPAIVGGEPVRIGILICFDLRFPERGRDLLKQGVDVVLVPARWPSVRREAWKTLLKARAIENQVFVVGCNARGREGGPSFVFDPLGREVRPVRHPFGRGWKRYQLDGSVSAQARALYDARDAVGGRR